MRLKKENGYVLELESRKLKLFDPDKCLKVGRHDDILGIVYEVPVPGGVYDRDGEWHKTKRGLIHVRKETETRYVHGHFVHRPWLGQDPAELAAAAAETALRIAGMSTPPRWLTTILSTQDNKTNWGDRKNWTDLVDRLQIGLNLETVKDVMET